jgi:hypothetical protein
MCHGQKSQIQHSLAQTELEYIRLKFRYSIAFLCKNDLKMVLECLILLRNEVCSY